jgi:hypothetical protein
MSHLMQTLLERLAEMFPAQSYQARLEKYIEGKNPQCVEDVHVHIKAFEECTQGR